MLNDMEVLSNHRPNYIFTDAKGKLLSRLYKPLTKNGYRIKVINLMDCTESNAYNPLQEIINEAKNDNIASAIRSCINLSDIIFNPQGQGMNTFFYNQAGSLFKAMVFAELSLAHSRYYGLNNYKTYQGKIVHDDGQNPTKNKYYQDVNGVMHSHVNAWNLINIHNILEMTIQLGGEEIKNNKNKKINQLFFYFDELDKVLKSFKKKQTKEKSNDSKVVVQVELLRQAVDNFKECMIAGTKTSGSIFSTFINQLRIYQQPELAKLTSLNNIDLNKLCFQRLLTVKFNSNFVLKSVSARLYNSNNFNKGYGSISSKPDEFFKGNTDIFGIINVPISKRIRTNTFYARLTVHDEEQGISITTTLKCQKHFYGFKDYMSKPKSYKTTVALKHAMLNHFGKVVSMHTHTQVLKSIDTTILKDTKHIISSTHLIFNNKPVALFIVMPPLRSEFSKVINALIGQLTEELSNISTSQLHIQRSIDFILDDINYLLPEFKYEIDSLINISHAHNVNCLLSIPNTNDFKTQMPSDILNRIKKDFTQKYFLNTSSKKMPEVLCTSNDIFMRALNLLNESHGYYVPINSMSIFAPHRYLNLEKHTIDIRKVLKYLIKVFGK